ncbi:TPA: restriction endonuclease subunit S [Streptococcus suis]
MKTNNNIPAYRFQGYTDAWELRKLGEVADVFDGTHQTPRYTNQGVMFLSVEDINTLESEKYISSEDFEKEFKIFPEFNDVLMTRIGDIGTSNIVKTNDEIAYYVSLALIKPKKLESHFLNSIIQSKDFQNELWKRTLHIAFPKKINKGEISEINLMFPTLPEQEAIGTFFSTLDRQITLHQRKLDTLKEQKKTYLKLLFPAKGQTKPALRFQGFEDDWEEVKLGDVVNIQKGTQRGKQEISEIQSEQFPYPVYNGGQNVSGYTDEYNRENMVIISEGGASAGYVNYYSGKFWSGGHNFSIDNLDNNLLYIKSILEFNQQKLYELKVGSGLPNVQLGSINQFTILLPSLPEQEAIGTFFQTLDQEMAQVEVKLACLKEMKKTLLRKLFV